MQARMAQGHDGALDPTPLWDIPALAGAGAVRSDADDLLSFLAAELGYVATPLGPAMRAQYVLRRPTGRPGLEISLGWHVRASPTGEVVWHNGGTGGFRTFMGFDPKAGLGVVVLTNVGNAGGGDDIGFHLLTGAPLAPQPPVHHAVPLDPAAIPRLTGRYEVPPLGVLEIASEGGRLLVRTADKNTIEILPEGPLSFFARGLDAQIVFTAGPDGRASGLVLRQGGHELPGRRIP
jgi:CubicO group peptidase (beta-lactamase class C family)